MQYPAVLAFYDKYRLVALDENVFRVVTVKDIKDTQIMDVEGLPEFNDKKIIEDLKKNKSAQLADGQCVKFGRYWLYLFRVDKKWHWLMRTAFKDAFGKEAHDKFFLHATEFKAGWLKGDKVGTENDIQNGEHADAPSTPTPTRVVVRNIPQRTHLKTSNTKVRTTGRSRIAPSIEVVYDKEDHDEEEDEEDEVDDEEDDDEEDDDEEDDDEEVEEDDDEKDDEEEQEEEEEAPSRVAVRKVRNTSRASPLNEVKKQTTHATHRIGDTTVFNRRIRKGLVRAIFIDGNGRYELDERCENELRHDLTAPRKGPSPSLALAVDTLFIQNKFSSKQLSFTGIELLGCVGHYYGKDKKHGKEKEHGKDKEQTTNKVVILRLKKVNLREELEGQRRINGYPYQKGPVLISYSTIGKLPSKDRDAIMKKVDNLYLATNFANAIKEKGGDPLARNFRHETYGPDDGQVFYDKVRRVVKDVVAEVLKDEMKNVTRQMARARL
jgi:hypothetical protein